MPSLGLLYFPKYFDAKLWASLGALVLKWGQDFNNLESSLYNYRIVKIFTMYTGFGVSISISGAVVLERWSF